MKRIKAFLLLLAVTGLMCFLCGCVDYTEPVYPVLSFDEVGKEWFLDYGAKTIRYDGITYSYTVENAGLEDPTVTIRYPNGATYNGSATVSGWSDDYDETQYASGETLVKLIRPAYVGRKIGPSALNIILALICIVLGVLSLCMPRTIWDLNHIFRGWQYENPEPSDYGLDMVRIGGVVSIILGVIVFFMKWR